VATLRRGRETYVADERVLGSSEFVEQLRREAGRRDATQQLLRARGPEFSVLLRKVAAAVGISPTALTGGGRSRVAARARDGLAYLWVDALGRSGHALARALALHPVSAYRAARRGRAQRSLWDPLLVEKSY
jgi:hypothetical protein